MTSNRVLVVHDEMGHPSAHACGGVGQPDQRVLYVIRKCIRLTTLNHDTSAHRQYESAMVRTQMCHKSWMQDMPIKSGTHNTQHTDKQLASGVPQIASFTLEPF